MSLTSRLGRLERALGTDAPRRAIVFYGPHYGRHAIERPAGDALVLTVPCPEDGDPRKCLSIEQRDALAIVDSAVFGESIVSPRDRIVFFEGFDDGRDPDLLECFEVVDDGRDDP
jgi:hypothetical protein